MTKAHGLTTDEVNALIQISNAHGVRTAARHNSRSFKNHIASAKANIESAKQDLRDFGCYLDCGEAYEAQHNKAEGKLATVNSLFEVAYKAEIAAERHYKQTRDNLVGQYPRITPFVEGFLSEQNANRNQFNAFDTANTKGIF
jgi:hypothetical protein